MWWKAVEVGVVTDTQCIGGGSLDEMRLIRDRVKEAVGAHFVDDGYSLLSLNCYSFCYSYMAHLGLEKQPGYIEAFNDRSHHVPVGTTYNLLHPKTALKRNCIVS